MGLAFHRVRFNAARIPIGVLSWSLFSREKGQTKIKATPEKNNSAERAAQSHVLSLFVRPLRGRFEEVEAPTDSVGLRLTATVVFPRRGKEVGEFL